MTADMTATLDLALDRLASGSAEFDFTIVPADEVQEIMKGMMLEGFAHAVAIVRHLRDQVAAS